MLHCNANDGFITSDVEYEYELRIPVYIGVYDDMLVTLSSLIESTKEKKGR